MAYGVYEYGWMLGDPVRMDAHLAALEQVIKPGCSVLDLGAGFGYMALVACQLGARRVYAIEPARAIGLLPELARLNGFGERVVAIKGLSTRTELPEQVDVIVADIRGVVPLMPGALAALSDARKRLLAPGGTLIPLRDRMFVAGVDDRSAFVGSCKPWERVARGLDLGPVEALLRNDWRVRQVDRANLLTAPGQWAVLEYGTLESGEVSGEVELEVQAPGTLHGFAMWFDAELIPGISLSNAPGQPKTVYGAAFLPVTPVHVQPGDRVTFAADVNEINAATSWRWRMRTHRGAELIASSEHATFHSLPLSLAELKARLPTSVPSLGPKGEVARVVLGAAAEGRTLGEIARTLVHSFPARFDTELVALDYAASLLERYRE